MDVTILLSAWFIVCMIPQLELRYALGLLYIGSLLTDWSDFAAAAVVMVAGYALREVYKSVTH